jgi:hypothetical protein
MENFPRVGTGVILRVIQYVLVLKVGNYYKYENIDHYFLQFY